MFSNFFLFSDRVAIAGIIIKLLLNFIQLSLPFPAFNFNIIKTHLIQQLKVIFEPFESLNDLKHLSNVLTICNYMVINI